MISVWNPLINRLFKNVRKTLVVHDPKLHEGEKIIFFGLSKQYGSYDTLVVHSKKYVDVVRDAYNKPTYYIPLGRHNLYRNCAKKETIVEYDPESVNFIFFGRISKYKGLDILAKAYKRLCEMTKDISITLTVVGNGNFEPYGTIRYLTKFIG